MTAIAGRRVLVTGGASGLGRLLALRFAGLGGRCVLWDLDRAGAARAAQEIGARTGLTPHVDAVDVGDREQVYAAAERLRAEHGQLDVLVNNAGIMHGGLLLEHPDEAIAATLRVNTLALFWVTKAFLPDMLARDAGHIVTLASAGGLLGVPRLSAYVASKHAAVGFHDSLRAELRELAPRVRTTVVLPYFVDTGLAEGVQTRFPRLLPILSQERVADRVVRAVQRDRLVTSMPFMVKVVPWAKLLPAAATDRLAAFFGIHDAMRDFVGRHGPRSPRP